MQQLIENLKNGDVRVVNSPVPALGDREILVKNVASLISPGTEKLMIEMGQKNIVGKAMARPDLVSLAFQKAKREGFLNVFREAMDRLDEPLPLGYSSAGTVLEVGRNVAGFSPGDRVACAGAGVASHAEVIAVPESMCVRIPEKLSGGEISFEEGSFVMLGGIALQGLRCAGMTFGERVVVVGLGLIGLLIVQIAKAYGCSAIGIDIDPEKVALAEKLGCDLGLVLGRDSVEQSVLNLTDGNGADAVILAAATKDNSPVLLAERISRKRGRIVLVGVSDLSLTRKAFWDKELSFTVSKASGPGGFTDGVSSILPVELARWTEPRNLAEFIRLLRSGSLRVLEMVTHRVSLSNATKAYEMILNGTERYIGVVITYPEEETVERKTELRNKDVSRDLSPDNKRAAVGVVGAGLFTRNVLLPNASRVPGMRFIGIAAKSGVSSRHVGDKFKFQYATTDIKEILEDESIGSVIITTRHNLHAEMIVSALSAGKNVFVEKPLCTSREQLSSVVEAFSHGSSVLVVGFNRRYAPLGVRLEQLFSSRTAPMQIHYRVNAGFIPATHWTQDPHIGGGRIVGEVCHFIDFLQFITNEEPIEVFSSSIGGNTGRFGVSDNVELSVRFSRGSSGAITYTALGSKAFSRERVEVFCDESVAVLEDFKTLEFTVGSKKKTIRLWNQDMGYRRELTHFLSATPSDSRDSLRSAVLTTLATFAAETSLRTRTCVPISLGDIAL